MQFEDLEDISDVIVIVSVLSQLIEPNKNYDQIYPKQNYAAKA